MAHYEGKGEQKIAYLIIELFHSTLSDDSPLDPQINAMMHTANTITTLGLPLHEKLIALAIIISLPPSYETLKTILTASKSTELTVENVRSQIGIEEHRRMREADSSSVFTAHFKGTLKGKNKDLKFNRSCSYCKKPSHKVKDCYKLKAKCERDAAMAPSTSDSTALRAQMCSYNDDPICLFHVANKLAKHSDLTDRWLINSGAS